MRSLYGISLIALTLVACGSDTASGGTDSGTGANEVTGNGAESGAGSEAGQTSNDTTPGGSTSTGDPTSTVASSTVTSGDDETGESTAAESSSGTSSGPDTSEPTTTGVEPPPNTVIQGCNTAADYEISTYRTSRVGETPVFAVGIYTDGSFGDSSSYEVEWALDGNGVLVLTGYEEAVWNVTVAAGASLSQVLVLSGEGATVNLEGSDAEVDLSIGQAQWTETACGRITSVGTGFGITAYSGTTFDVFDDYAAAAAGVPSSSIENVASGRLAEHDDVLYAGNTTLERYQLPGGAPLGSITLEGSPFVRGLSSALGSIVVYDDDVDSLRRFDPNDGTLLETIPLDFEVFFGGVDSIICFDAE